MTLVALFDGPVLNDRQTTVSVRFWPGTVWYRQPLLHLPTGFSNKFPNNKEDQYLVPATREDIMTALEDVDLFLLR